MTNFMGYGSPQALEAAIKAGEDEHFESPKKDSCMLSFAVICPKVRP